MRDNVKTWLRRTRSARSSSASLPVPSTLKRAPKTLTLSVSIAVDQSFRDVHSQKRVWNRTGVGNQDFAIFQTFRRVNGNCLVKNKT